MRRCVLLACLALLVGLATPAIVAAPPTIFHHDVYQGVWDAPVGTLCDFNYHQEYRIEEDAWYYADGRERFHDNTFVAHTNADTGFTLSEVDHINYFYEGSTGRYKQVGLFWHLRTPDGKLVLVQAGQIIYDTTQTPWVVVKVTPNFNPEFAAVICPALGGNPAP